MKTMLFCGLGMSTSLLVERMKMAAIDKSINADFEAHAIDSFADQLEPADVVLLGPQIRYKKNTFFPIAQAANIPRAIVHMKTYGTLNGEKALD